MGSGQLRIHLHLHSHLPDIFHTQIDKQASTKSYVSKEMKDIKINRDFPKKIIQKHFTQPNSNIMYQSTN